MFGQCTNHNLSIQTSSVGSTITAHLVLNGDFTNIVASQLQFNINYTGNTSTPSISTSCNSSALDVSANSSSASVWTPTTPSLLSSVFGSCNGSVIATLTFQEQQGDCINFTISPSSSYTDAASNATCFPFFSSTPVVECTAPVNPCTSYSLNIQTNMVGSTVFADLVVSGNFSGITAAALDFDLTFSGNSSTPTISTTCDQLGTSVFANSTSASFNTVINPSNLGSIFSTCSGNVLATLVFQAQPGECINIALGPQGNDFYVDSGTGTVCPAGAGPNQQVCVPVNCPNYGLDVQTSIVGNTVTADLVLNGSFSGVTASSLNFDIDYSGNSSTPTITTSCLQSLVNVNAGSGSASLQTAIPNSDLSSVFGSCGGSVIATLTFQAQPGECIDFDFGAIGSDFFIDSTTGQPCNASTGPNQQACVPDICTAYNVDVQTSVVGNTIVANLVVNGNFSTAVASQFDFDISFMGNSNTPTISSACGQTVTGVSANNNSASFSTTASPSFLGSALGSCNGNVVATLVFQAQPGECIDFIINTSSFYIDDATGTNCFPFFNPNAVQECVPLTPVGCGKMALSVQTSVVGNTITADLVFSGAPFNFTVSQLEFYLGYTGNSSTPTITSACSQINTNVSATNSLALFETTNNPNQLSTVLGSCNGNVVATLTFQAQPGECIDFVIDSNTFIADGDGFTCSPSFFSSPVTECTVATCPNYGLNIQTNVVGNTITADLLFNGNLSGINASQLFFDLVYTGNSNAPVITSACDLNIVDVNANNTTATFETVFNPSPLGAVFGSCNGNVIATLTFQAQPGECIDFSLHPFNSDFYIDANNGVVCDALIGQPQQACVPPASCINYDIVLDVQDNGCQITVDVILNGSFPAGFNFEGFQFFVEETSGNIVGAANSSPTCNGVLSNWNPVTETLQVWTGNNIDANTLQSCSAGNVIASLTFSGDPGVNYTFSVRNDSHYGLNGGMCFPNSFQTVSQTVSQTVTISGQVTRPACSNAPLEGINVEATDANGNTYSALTNANGLYNIEACPGTYNVRVCTFCNQISGDVNNIDEIELRKIALGINFASQNSWLTGDVNMSDHLSTLDVVLIRKGILGQPLVNPNWCNFVPSSEVSQVLSAFDGGVNIPPYSNAETVVLNTITPSANVNFELYALGNVDGSCTDPTYGENEQIGCMAPGVSGTLVLPPGPPKPTIIVLPPLGPSIGSTFNGGKPGLGVLPAPGTGIGGTGIGTVGTGIGTLGTGIGGLNPTTVVTQPVTSPVNAIIIIWPTTRARTLNEVPTESLGFVNTNEVSSIYLAFDIAEGTKLDDLGIEATDKLDWDFNIVNNQLLLIGQTKSVDELVSFNANETLLNIYLENDDHVTLSELNNWNFIVNENFEFVKLVSDGKEPMIERNNGLNIESFFNSTLMVDSKVEQSATIEIMDIFGNVVYQTDYEFIDGANQINITERFNLGVYVVHIYNEQNRATKNIFIK